MRHKIRFESLLDGAHPVILDGGLATELEAQGYDLHHKLWSARLLIENPQAIADAHLAYLEAGAQIITTASYQASVVGFGELGMDAGQARDALLQSVRLAVEARDMFMARHPGIARPLVAASIGPYGAYLADGSEYTGNYGLEDEDLAGFHRQRLEWLDHSGADVLACETIPDLQEARVLAGLLKDVTTPAWVSFSCRDGPCLNDGSGIETAACIFNDHPAVFALGVNCTAPEFVSELIARVRAAAPGKATVVYPNSGEQYDAASNSWNAVAGQPDFLEFAQDWKSAGADIIGGCCRIGPGQIKSLARTLHKGGD